jgi:reprolysin-like metallo-peptidase family M12B
MNKWTQRRHRLSRLFFLSALAMMAGGRAYATVPVTAYVVINPIDVCDTAGPSGSTGCAPFNSLSVSPNPAQATSSTPIGFVDPATNVNVTRAIWLQTGIDVTFLPIQEYNNTTYEKINDIACGNSGCTSLTSVLFKTLSTPSGPAKATGCKSNCTVPFPSKTANAINMFFVDQISGTGGSLAGFAWLNGNGVAVSSSVFSFSSLVASRFDTLAHELGHNLNLDHSTNGVNSSTCGTSGNPPCNNTLDAGGVRLVAGSSGCSSTSPVGLLFDLNTGLCGTGVSSPTPVDQLILGNSTTNTQQAEVLLSGFLNPVPNVNATAGGGDLSFTVNFPKINQAGGRNGEYIFALVIALPQGFQFSNNIFTQTGGNAVVFGFEQLNGNNGQGNTNCLKPLNGGPSIQCLEIDFVPGTFTANTSISFTSDIINKSTGQPATLADVTCTPPETGTQCLDLTYVFNDLLATSSAFAVRDKSGTVTANSQLPDAGVSSTIVDPTNFPSVANLNPPLTLTSPVQPPILCTASSANACPPFSGGNWLFSGE